ncbi:MAG TPA: hypothetical protein PLX03_10465, partial [Candidatus Hydrogenedentes bacterium]|nr:hypothetical protein [Candidatus Hydrogenedentota bacterium]
GIGEIIVTANRRQERAQECHRKETNMKQPYIPQPIDVSRIELPAALAPLTEALARNLRVMDATAISLCRENRLPVMVFDLSRPGNILRVLRGEPIGTMVKGE